MTTMTSLKGPQEQSASLLAHEDDPKLFCQICDDKSSKVPAEGFCLNCRQHLCKSCYDYHRKPKPCRNHMLLDKAAMPTSMYSTKEISCFSKFLFRLCHRRESYIDRNYHVQTYFTIEDENSFGASGFASIDGARHLEETDSTPTTNSNEHNFNVKIRMDENPCRITGISKIALDRLAVVDNNNLKIKLLNLKRKKVTAHLALPSPWGVTTIADNTVAVTLPKEGKIQVIEIGDRLSLKQTIKAEKWCYGIYYHQEKFVVGYKGVTGTIRILDMAGKILVSVVEDSRKRTVFQWPQYIVANGSSVYISDYGNSTIIRLSWQGEVVGRCVIAGGAGGLAASQDGRLYACDNGRGKVLAVSQDCYRGEIVLEGLERLQSLFWCEDTCTLFTSSWTFNAESDNFIQQYKINLCFV